MTARMRVSLLGTFVLLLAAALLAGSMATGKGDYDRYAGALERITWLDSQLDNAILRVHVGNEYTYDRITAILQEYLAMVPVLESHPDLGSLTTSIARKAALIERFKSFQAIFSNSSRLVVVLEDELRQSPEYQGLSNDFDPILTEILWAVVRNTVVEPASSSGAVRLALQRALDHPKYGHLAALPEWQFLRIHIDNLTRVSPQRNALFDDIRKEPVTRLIRPMSLSLDAAYESANTRSKSFQIASFILSATLLLLVIQKVSQIWRHKKELESRIEERTSQLKDANTALVREIEEKELAQKELAQAQKLEAIGQLSAGIAHEINTPTQYVGDNIRFLHESFSELLSLMGPIVGHGGNDPVSSIEDLRQQLESADFEFLMEEIPRATGESLEGIERVTGIVRALKEFAHPSKDKEPVDINRAIQSTSTVATNEWKYIANLELDLDETLPAVPCVVSEINQVVLNLIVNASHAISDAAGDSGEKGKISISTKQSGDFAEIVIQDSGTGIEPDVAERIFEPFFTTKDVGKGTGQGLAIAHNVIVEKHRGSIDVESEIGVGTIFSIQLPLTASNDTVDPGLQSANGV